VNLPQPFAPLIAWRAQAQRLRAALADLPPARWPLAWHVGAAVTLAGAAGLAVTALHLSAGQRRDAATALLLQSQAAVAQARALPGGSAAPPALAWLEPARLDDVVRDIGRFAAERDVRVGSLRIEHDAAPADPAQMPLAPPAPPAPHAPTSAAQIPAVPQVRIACQAAGAYAALKGWLSDLLARHPALAARAVTLQAPAAPGQAVAAAVSFVVFLKPAGGAAALAGMAGDSGTPAMRPVLEAMNRDPFAAEPAAVPASTVATAPRATVARPAAETPATEPAPPPPPSAPPVDLAFTGRMVAPDGTLTVFAQSGGQAVTLTPGAVTPAGWRVQRISDSGADLLYPPLNTTARVDFPRPPAFELR